MTRPLETSRVDETQTLAEELSKRFPRFFRDPRESAAVAARFQAHDWEQDAVLYRFGEMSDRMHFVPRGALEISLDAGDNDAPAHVFLAGGGDGTFVGELGMLRPGRVSATVRASTPLRSFELSHSDLLAMLGSEDRTERRAANHLVSALGVLVAERLRQSSAGHFTKGPGDVTSYTSAIAALRGDNDAPPFEGLSEVPPALDTGWSPSRQERKALDEKVLKAIREEPELKPLGDATLKMLSRMVMLQRAQPGDVVIGADTTAHGVYLVVEGEVHVVVEPDTDEPAHFQVDRRLGPGAVFGMVAYALRCPPTATVRASAPDTTLAVFSEPQLREIERMGEAGLAVGAHFRHWMAGQLADDARALNERILADFKAWSAANAG